MQWLQSTVSTILKKRNVYALKEIQRVSQKIVLSKWTHIETKKEIFLSWVLTAEYHGYPDEWISI